jgi:TPP-dependent pyruvate/acetoin dehydrogenase alpha subunit
MYRKGYIHGYFHSYIGEEAIAAGACQALRNDDYIVSTHRGHGHSIAKGTDMKFMMAELFGRRDGCSKGRGGSMHMSDNALGNIGGNGIVGAGIPLAVGVGMGIRQEKSDRVVVCFLGDGASNNGVFAESLNLAAIYSLPVIFIIENNCYAATTPIRQTALCENLSERGTGYGVESKSIFGNDPIEVFASVKTAVEKARKRCGPTLIEAKTYRQNGHHVNDPGHYMPEDEKTKWKAFDPLALSIGYLKQAGIEDSIITAINGEVERAILEAVEFAMNSPEPDVGEFLRSIEVYNI